MAANDGRDRHDPKPRPGTRLYAVGDVHGCADRLRALYEMIDEDARRAAAPRTVIVHIGDYVDRGPDSRAVLDILTGPAPAGAETVFLMGNHEDMMLTFLETGKAGGVWLLNGGDATCESYGVLDAASACSGRDFAPLHEALCRRVPQSHRDFLRGLRLSHREGDFLFVHAGLNPDRAPDDQDRFDLLWIREPFLHSRRDFGAMVVHGHTARGAPEVQPNRICIDTGAYRSGRLTALVADEHGFDFLDTSALPNRAD